MWKFFDSTGAEKQISVPRASLVTALPSNPADGDEIIFTDSLTAGTYHWRFRYVSARASNKWVFVGGNPLYAEVTTQEGTSSATYTALATAGPSVTVPVAGDYHVDLGCTNVGSTTNEEAYMSYDIGATGAVDADATVANQPALGAESVMRRRKKSLTAVALTAKYRNASASTTTFRDRWISILPIAIGG